MICQIIEDLLLPSLVSKKNIFPNLTPLRNMLFKDTTSFLRHKEAVKRDDRGKQKSILLLIEISSPGFSQLS